MTNGSVFKLNSFFSQKIEMIIRYRKYIIIVFCAFPVVLGFLYVFRFGVNIVFWDQWEVVPLLEKLHSATLTLQDLFAQHNEHRIFFPVIIMLFLAYLSKYDTIVEMIFVQFLLLIELLVFYLVAKKEFKFNLRNIPLWFILVPLLMFSWRQYENMLWGFQISFIMPLIGGVLSFYFIEKLFKPQSRSKNLIFFVLAVCFAVISSFSSIMGLFVWIAGLFQILLSMNTNIFSLINPFSKKSAKKYLFYLWILIGISTWIIYFVGYHQPKNHEAVSFQIFSHPLQSIEYFGVCLGGFWGKVIPSFLWSGYLLLLFAFTLLTLFFKRCLQKNSFWLAVIIFTLLTITSITLGRAGFGIQQAVASRYTTYSIAFVVSLYIIIIKIFKYELSQLGPENIKVTPAASLKSFDSSLLTYTGTGKYVVSSNDFKKNSRYSLFLGSFLGLLVFGSGVAYFEGYQWGTANKVYLINAKTALIGHDRASDQELKTVYPDPAIVRERVEILEKLRYNIFDKY